MVTTKASTAAMNAVCFGGLGNMIHPSIKFYMFWCLEEGLVREIEGSLKATQRLYAQA